MKGWHRHISVIRKNYESSVKKMNTKECFLSEIKRMKRSIGLTSVDLIGGVFSIFLLTDVPKKKQLLPQYLCSKFYHIVILNTDRNRKNLKMIFHYSKNASIFLSISKKGMIKRSTSIFRKSFVDFKVFSWTQ